MNLKPLQDYIAAHTDLVFGQDLFEYSLPARVTKAVVLVLEPANAYVDHEIPGLFKNRFQVIVRDPVFDDGRARADELFDLLKFENVDLTEYKVDYCRPRHKPLPFSRSAGDTVEFSINFEIRYRE